MIAFAILAPYAIGLGLHFAGISAVWPWLLLSCAMASLWSLTGPLALAAGVILVQIAKMFSTPNEVWVYYAAIYTTIGFICWLIGDRLVAATCAIIGAVFLSSYVGVPRLVTASLTEIALIAGAVGFAYGSGGGILGKIYGTFVVHEDGGVGSVALQRGSDRG